jgi:hypothetical protein
MKHAIALLENTLADIEQAKPLTVEDAEFQDADTKEFKEAISVLQRHEDRIGYNAGLLYDAYCAAVGGVAFNGDPLPDWKTFRADPAKQKQVEAWIAVGRTAAGDGGIIQNPGVMDTWEEVDQWGSAVTAVRRIADIHHEKWDEVLVQQAAQIILDEFAPTKPAPVVWTAKNPGASHFSTAEADELRAAVEEAMPDIERDLEAEAAYAAKVTEAVIAELQANGSELSPSAFSVICPWVRGTLSGMPEEEYPSPAEPEQPITIRGWLETLPDGYRERALANMGSGDGLRGIRDADDLGQAIAYAFDWGNSPEGYHFWYIIRRGEGFPPLPEPAPPADG